MGRVMQKFFVFAIFLAFLAYLLGRPTDGIPILTYHHVGDGKEWYYVSAGEFENQLKFLQENGFQVLSVAEASEVLAGKGTLPKRPVVITFDDGYEDNYSAALPVLEKYGMRATFFVTTGKMGQPDYLTWDQVRAMRQRGMEIGSHTVNHYTLNEINLKEFERELLSSRLMLQNNVTIAAVFFANPFGETAPAVVELLRQTGYQAACASIVGMNRPGENPYRLKRMSVPRSSLGIWEFRLRLWRLYAGARLGIW
jgi:peptidoglycan/xylan/chitin deacetylase (PgdA/CDA1 family)